MPPEGLGRSRRITGKAAFDAIFRRGTAVRAEWLALKALPNGRSHSRFGCTVRRIAAPGGVTRNRYKRWLREAFRRNRSRVPAGWDLVAILSRRPPRTAYRDFEKEFLDLCHRLQSPQRFS